jgi:hypothetical protein
MMICLTKASRVTITGVQPLSPVGHITVQAFAVRPSPFMAASPGEALGDGDGPLSQNGFAATHTVAIVCGSSKGAGVELGVQLTKPTTQDVGAAGWIVSYTVGGHHKHMTVPLGVKLCSERTADAAMCRRLDHYFLTTTS